MPHQRIELNNVDLYQYPKEIRRLDVKQLTIGDLHANAMLLMYILVSTGLVEISESDYLQLAQIYKKNELSHSDLDAFNKLIDGLTICTTEVLIRFIGDEVCDRGQNDYFIFKILDKLKKSRVPTEILLSNHGIEFLIPYEKSLEKRTLEDQLNELLEEPLEESLEEPSEKLVQVRWEFDSNGQADSLKKMTALMEKKLIKKCELDFLVQGSYLPQLKLLSYSLEGDEITIYSHAPIDHTDILRLAHRFGVTYHDESAKALAQTIEAINKAFEVYVRARTVHTLIDVEQVYFILWNRNLKALNRKKQHHYGYSIYYVHGHHRDRADPQQENVINLDSIFGKGLGNHEGTLVVLSGHGSDLTKVQDNAASAAKAALVIQELFNQLMRQLNEFTFSFESASSPQALNDLYQTHLSDLNALQQQLVCLTSAHDFLSKEDVLKAYKNQLDAMKSAVEKQRKMIEVQQLLDKLSSLHEALMSLGTKIQQIDNSKNEVKKEAQQLKDELEAAVTEYEQQLNGITMQKAMTLDNIKNLFQEQYEQAFKRVVTLSEDLGWSEWLKNKLKTFANALITVIDPIARCFGRQGFFAHYELTQSDFDAYSGFKQDLRPFFPEPPRA